MRTGLALACVALAAGATGFAVYRFRLLTGAPPAAGPVAATPAPGSVSADSAPKRVIPDTVPDVSLADLDDKLHSLRDYRGRPTIYNFWATWCAPCRREIPLLNRLHTEFAGRHLQIVGIAVDFKDDVAKYAHDTHFSYPLLVGEEAGLAAAEKFGMEMALPFSIFVDSRQRIVAAKIGELHREDADAIITALYAVDSGQLPIQQAKAQVGARLRELALARATN
jgi:peroxiredoxin